MTLSRQMVGHLALLCFAPVVSFFMFGALVANRIDPGVWTSFRFVVAAVVLLAFAGVNGLPLRNILRGRCRWLIFVGLLHHDVRGVAAYNAPGHVGRVCAAKFARRRVRRGIDRARTGVTILEANVLGGIGALVVGGTYSFSEAMMTDYSVLRTQVRAILLYLGVITTAVILILLRMEAARIATGKVMAYTYILPSLVLVQGFFPHGKREAAFIYVGIAIALVALIVLELQEAQSAQASCPVLFFPA